jgi:hypothetical protein
MNRIVIIVGSIIVVVIIILLLFKNCKGYNKPKQGNPLARVYNNYLYRSDIEGLGKGLSPEDSAKQVATYIDKWVVDQLVLGVAVQKLGGKNDTKINRLVEAYRNSLIIANYEQELVNRELDTVVTPMQLADYYTQNKEEYVSGQNWLRCHFIKVKRDITEAEDLRRWFKSAKDSDFEKVKQFCLSKQGVSFALEKDHWVRYDKILAQLPGNNLEQGYLSPDRVYDRTDDQYLYLLRVFEFRDKNAPTPLSQVQDEISRIILHQRRSEILQNLRKTATEKGKGGKVSEKF